MHGMTRIRLALAATMALALTADGSAQSAAATRLQGTFSDFSDIANASGAWHMTGEWSVDIKGASGKADVVININMMRATSGGSPHTHHVALLNATVNETATGYTITGAAAITSNGALAGFTGSPITVEISGSPAVVPSSNFKVTFGGGAVSHFGTDPIDGVVTLRP